MLRSCGEAQCDLKTVENARLGSELFKIELLAAKNGILVAIISLDNQFVVRTNAISENIWADDILSAWSPVYIHDIGHNMYAFKSENFNSYLSLDETTGKMISTEKVTDLEKFLVQVQNDDVLSLSTYNSEYAYLSTVEKGELFDFSTQFGAKQRFRFILVAPVVKNEDRARKKRSVVSDTLVNEEKLGGVSFMLAGNGQSFTEYTEYQRFEFESKGGSQYAFKQPTAGNYLTACDEDDCSAGVEDSVTDASRFYIKKTSRPTVFNIMSVKFPGKKLKMGADSLKFTESDTVLSNFKFYILKPKDALTVGLETVSGSFIRADKAENPLWTHPADSSGSFNFIDMGNGKFALQSEYYQTYLRCGKPELTTSNDVAVMEKWFITEERPGKMKFLCEHESFNVLADSGVVGDTVQLGNDPGGTYWGLPFMAKASLPKLEIGDESLESLYANRVNPCEPHGYCMDLINAFRCECHQGFTGELCHIDINECSSGPCLNGATCIDNESEWFCQCAPGFTGWHCNVDINECLSKPCLNGGTCHDKIGSYECICEIGFHGDHCQSDVDSCISDPCNNGATCRNLIGDVFTCSCVDGYEAELCDVNTDECYSQPCKNGGFCEDKIDSFTCECDPGWTGVDCSIDINECSSDPCKNNAICTNLFNDMFLCKCTKAWTGVTCQENIDECASQPCLNGATCNDHEKPKYTCDCLQGWYGTDCELPFGECASLPCENESTCIEPFVNYFQCLCPLGFTGVFCEIDQNECESNPCIENQSTCVDLINEWVCQCEDGFTGALCQININECSSQPCQHQFSVCEDKISEFDCDCPNGWRGLQRVFLKMSYFEIK